MAQGFCDILLLLGDGGAVVRVLYGKYWSWVQMSPFLSANQIENQNMYDLWHLWIDK